MHVLLRFVGFMILFSSIFIQPLIAETSIDEVPPEPTVCVGKLGEMYCRTWEEFLKVLRRLLENCKEKSADHSDDFLSSMQQCLRNKTVSSLDRMLRSDVISLIGGLELVRNSSMASPSNYTEASNKTMADGRHVTEVEEEWKWQVLDRVAELFRSHVIRLRLEEVEGRGRHQYKHLFPLMMFAFMKMLVILVPLGFQFMAVISGKALLLSKMALALASAQAMKKVTSAWFDVYHSPQPSYYQHLHRSYENGHPSVLHAPIQGFQPGFSGIPSFPNFGHVYPELGSVAHHPAPVLGQLHHHPEPVLQATSDVGQFHHHHADPNLGHATAIPHHQDHQPSSQEYQFVFTGADHQPLHFPPVPTVYDQPGLADSGEELVDKRYVVRRNYSSYQRNRNKIH